MLHLPVCAASVRQLVNQYKGRLHEMPIPEVLAEICAIVALNSLGSVEKKAKQKARRAAAFHNFIPHFDGHFDVLRTHIRTHPPNSHPRPQ